MEITDLSHAYAMNGTKNVTLKNVTLKNVSMTLKAGQVSCILGPSGCGKTTLLNILAGFIKPTSGKILIDSEPVVSPGPDRGVIFQEDALFPWLTVKENILFGLNAGPFTQTEKQQKTDAILEAIGLKDAENALPHMLSGGMKQRVALARVLVLEPRILLLDEPFAALDAFTRQEMQSLLLSFQQKLNQTLFFITHDVTEAVLISDTVYIMTGSPGSFTGDPIHLPHSHPRKKNAPAYLESVQQIEERLYRISLKG